MSSYTKLNPQPAPRSDAMKVRYTKDAAQLADLPWPCPWEQIAPGLYPDEVAYMLDTGEHVAISVEKDWQGNITGFHVYARWINPDGSTKFITGLTTKDVEVSWSFALSTCMVETFGLAEIMKDCYRMILGDEPSLTHDVLDEDGNVIGTTPLIELDPTSHENRSIRVALSLLPTFEDHLTVDL